MAERLSSEAWIDAALETLAERGIDAVAVEPLARRLGVTKGSFYWHFRDRAALSRAMLRRWEQTKTDSIVAEVEGGGGAAEAKLRALFEIAFASGRMDLEAALRLWARSEPWVQRALERVDARRMAYLQALFEQCGLAADEARTRTFVAYSCLFGDYFIAARTGSRRKLLERCTNLLLYGARRTKR